MALCTFGCGNRIGGEIEMLVGHLHGHAEGLHPERNAGGSAWRPQASGEHSSPVTLAVAGGGTSDEGVVTLGTLIPGVIGWSRTASHNVTLLPPAITMTSGLPSASLASTPPATAGFA